MAAHPAQYGILSSRDVVGMMNNIYEDTLAKVQPQLDLVFFHAESDKSQEQYAWLGAAPVMEEWKGDRKVTEIPAYDFTIKNKVYTSGVKILKDDHRRDKKGNIQQLIQEIPMGAARNPLILLADLVNNGGTELCYDGQFFFDDDHSEHLSGSQDNNITTDISALAVTNHGDVTTPSVEEFIGAVLKSIRTMLAFKNDQGQPMNQFASEFLLHVPIAYSDVAYAAVGLTTLDHGKNNILKRFKIEVLVDPLLTAADTFFLYRTDGTGKPFIHQVEVDVVFDALAETSEQAVKSRHYEYYAEKIESIGYGKWQYAVKNQLS